MSVVAMTDHNARARRHNRRQIRLAKYAARIMPPPQAALHPPPLVFEPACPHGDGNKSGSTPCPAIAE
jgi:ribosomal protein L13E